MISFFKTALVSLLMTTGLVVSAATVRTKYTGNGYNAGAYALYDTNGCPAALASDFFNIYAYSSASKFKATGQDGYDVSTEYDELYASFAKSSCDGTTRTYQRGSIYDFSDYGGTVPATFKIFKRSLKEASVEGVKVPVYKGSCTYECTEICYAEIFGYGTCPPYDPYLECPESCEPEEYIGNADINVNWKIADGKITQPERSSDSSSFSYDGYSQSYRSKGSYRYDIPVTFSVTSNGDNVFPSSPSYLYGSIGSTMYNELTKTSS